MILKMVYCVFLTFYKAGKEWEILINLFDFTLYLRVVFFYFIRNRDLISAVNIGFFINLNLTLVKALNCKIYVTAL